MPRFSKTKKNLFISAKQGKAGNWRINFWDNSGERKHRTIKNSSGWTEAKVKKIAKKFVADLENVTLTPQKNIFSEDEVNAVIDSALKDKRINKDQYDSYKSQTLAERRRRTKHLSEVVDGKLLYKPKEKSAWKLLRENVEEISDREIHNLQWLYRKKILTANQLGVEIAEELGGELDYLSQAKSLDDVKKWEQKFDHKYAELVGDWRNTSATHINKSPEAWSNENIRNHARRKFMLEGFDKPTSVRMASEYVRNLSKTELDGWYESLFPIKHYNDRVYKLALETDSINALDNILAVHHVQPVSYGGESLNPENIKGIQGGRDRSSKGSEHEMVHNKMFDSWYDDQRKMGVTVGEITPPGVGVPPKVIDPYSKKLMPSSEWMPGIEESVLPERKAITGPIDISKMKEYQKIDFYNVLKNNPKKAMIAMALAPFMFGYSVTGAAQDEVPEGLLNVPREDRFLGTQAADNIWQATKYHTFKPGGALEWANIFDFTDLPFFGKGPQRYDTNLKTIEERKLRDPTWEY